MQCLRSYPGPPVSQSLVLGPRKPTFSLSPRMMLMCTFWEPLPLKLACKVCLCKQHSDVWCSSHPVLTAGLLGGPVCLSQSLCLPAKRRFWESRLIILVFKLIFSTFSFNVISDVFVFKTTILQFVFYLSHLFFSFFSPFFWINQVFSPCYFVNCILFF